MVHVLPRLTQGTAQAAHSTRSTGAARAVSRRLPSGRRAAAGRERRLLRNLHRRLELVAKPLGLVEDARDEPLERGAREQVDGALERPDELLRVVVRRIEG